MTPTVIDFFSEERETLHKQIIVLDHKKYYENNKQGNMESDWGAMLIGWSRNASLKW